MTGTEPVRSAILSDTRAQAAIAARRYGVPPTMIAAAAARSAVGDWRGACAAADVDVYLNPDTVRRRHGAVVAERLLAVLPDLAPDLLRWHLPRRGHGAGELLADLLVPLAECFGDDGRALTLAAMTPRIALDAGQRIVLTVLELDDPVTRALLDAVHAKQAVRHSLLRHAMFWSAAHARDLADMRDVTEITQLQDTGAFAEAWHAAGFELTGSPSPSRTRWLSALPILLPGLADRIRSVLPDADSVAIRSGVGALVVSGLNSATGPVRARPMANRDVADLPTLPTAAWARPVDIDLLRRGLLSAHELHPLVASALVADPAPPAPESDEWLYREVPYIAGPCHDAAVPTLWIQCGAATHRVAHVDGTWHPLDHPGHASRESLLYRLGGPTNPCQQATTYLASGRHVIDLCESLLTHGRVTEVRTLLHAHADIHAALDDLDLPTGSTVGERLAALRENTLQLRMLLSGATRPRTTAGHTVSHKSRRPTRKGVPARNHR